jgi:hypothetical protein
VHRRDVGLTGLALTNAVGAGLGEEQWFVPREVLKAREVRAKRRLAVQIDVERADVEAREIEKLSRGKVDVREQAVRRRHLRCVIQIAKKILDPKAPMPADDARWNLVAERKRQHRRVLA